MDRAFLHMHRHLNFSLEESVNAATLIPAEIIGLSNVGKISVGYKADLLSLNNVKNSATFTLIRVAYTVLSASYDIFSGYCKETKHAIRDSQLKLLG